jgi:cytochrome P450
MNLPTDQRERFVKWVEIFLPGLSGINPSAAAEAEKSIRDFFVEVVSDRAANPQDPAKDIITHLLTATLDGVPIPQEDVVTICLTVLAAGLDTTRSALGYIFLHLGRHPEHRAIIIENEANTPKVVEELLRVYPLVLNSGRMVKEDIDFHGCPMKKGDVLWIGLASSNHDGRKFEDPDEFQLSRSNVSQHLSFGAGPHRCLGLHLARHEIVIALNEWHKVIPDYTIDDTDLHERGAQLSLDKLPMKWEVAG